MTQPIMWVYTSRRKEKKPIFVSAFFSIARFA